MKNSESQQIEPKEANARVKCKKNKNTKNIKNATKQCFELKKLLIIKMNKFFPF